MLKYLLESNQLELVSSFLGANKVTLGIALGLFGLILDNAHMLGPCPVLIVCVCVFFVFVRNSFYTSAAINKAIPMLPLLLQTFQPILVLGPSSRLRS